MYDNRLWPESVRESAEVKFYEKNPLDTTKMSARFMMRLGPFLSKSLESARQLTTPILVIQGGADVLTLPAGAHKLLSFLGSKDKTIKTFPDADHFFYHTIFPKSIFRDDPVKREQVSAVVGDWIRAH